MSFMRPRKTLQLKFDKQFQPSDEISLKRGVKRVVLCKHEKSGGRSQVLTWSQNHLAVNIVIVTFNGLLTIVSGISVSLQQRSDSSGQNSQHSYHRISHFTVGALASHSNEKLLGKGWHSLVGGWLTCSQDTGHGHCCHPPSLSPDMTPCVLITDICVALHNVITQGKVSRPQVGLGEDRGLTPWAMCPPQGRAGHWLSPGVWCLQLSPGCVLCAPLWAAGPVWTQAARTSQQPLTLLSGLTLYQSSGE